MRLRTRENVIEYLCPRIISVEHKHVYYGGDQSWLPRNTAAKGGCGPVCGANILTVYADKNPQYQTLFDININEKHFVSQDEYLDLLQELYSTMHIWEIPVLSNIYDRISRTNRLFRYLPSTLGIDICHFTQGVLRYAAKKEVYLKHRSLSTWFCGYTRGLTFIKLALTNGYPVVMLTTNSKFPFMLYDRPYLQNGVSKKMAHHFVTITDIKETPNDSNPELVITTWGKTGVISYKDLYKSWHSIKAFGSGMVYFVPSKNLRTTKRSILRTYGILLKR
ncbi:MAG: hypothetical protein R3Y40_09845 [Eubacteriales bacterium]